MKFQRLSIAMIATAAGLSASAGAYAAMDIFVKFAGIDGETADKQHQAESEVFSVSWGAASTANGKKGCVQDMSLTKKFDKASAQLITKAATGATIPTATLSMRKAGESPVDFLKITMTNVKVSSYAAAGSSSYADAPTESVSLSFETMSGEYKSQMRDGTLDAGIPWVIGPNGAKCQ